MRLSISIICFIELILLKLSCSYSCENSQCDAGFERCVCSDCNETNTVGLIYEKNCFFIELNRTTKSINLSTKSENTTTSIRNLYDVINRQTYKYMSIDIVIQILSRHAYKALDINEIAFDARVVKAVFEKTLSETKNKCAVYQILKHGIEMEDDEECDSVEKVFVDSKFTRGISAYSFSLTPYNHKIFDKTKSFSCFPMKNTRGCAFLQHSSSTCTKPFKPFNVMNRPTYNFMENYSLFKFNEYYYRYLAFLVYFEPWNKLKLRKQDYYMVISRNVSQSKCYIADVMIGKLISQSSCEAAILNLKARYFKGMDTFTSMCRIPSHKVPEYLNNREMKQSMSTVSESEITHGNNTVVSETIDNDTVIILSQNKILTISSTNSIENVTTFFPFTSNPDIDDTLEETDYFLDGLIIINVTFACLIFLIVIVICQKKCCFGCM